MRKVTVSALAAVVVCASAGSAMAAIAVVIPHAYTCSNNSFSAFAYDPTLNPNKFLSGSYGAGADVRWNEVLDDTVEPWSLSGGTLYGAYQIEIYARGGFAANVATFQFWGMNWCPLDGTFFLEALSNLKAASCSTSTCPYIDAEIQLSKHYPGFPDGPLVTPTNVSVSNVGGVWKLIDNNLTGANGFVASGVQVGHRATVFPVGSGAKVYARVYIILEVLNNNEVRVNQDPCYDPSGVATDVGYLLSLQPHVTLGTFRQVIPYFVDHPTSRPLANYKGGMSPDGTMLYQGEQTTDNIIAIDTQVPESFTIFVSTAELQAYVQAQVDAGRHMAIINPLQVYTDSINATWSTWNQLYGDSISSDWNNQSVDTLVTTSSTEQIKVGSYSMKTTFNSAAAKLVLESDPTKAPGSADFESLDFWIHGGTSGGQTMDVALIDSNGVSSSVTLTPPAAGTWTHVVIPMSQFSAPHDIYRVVFDNTAPGAQSSFYLDQVVLNKSVDTTAFIASTEQFHDGTSSIKATFDSAAAKFVLESALASARPPTDYSSLDFWIHGGTAGGQSISVGLLNSSGAGNFVALTPPTAGTWTHVVIPMNQFTVSGEVFQIVLDNTAAGAQGTFHLDQVVLNWGTPLPIDVGAFNPADASVGTPQMDVDSKGRIWFSETATDDIIWTTDGNTLHTFLTSNDVQAASGTTATSGYSTGMQINGMIVDKMGSVYWGDNNTRSIWKAPAVDPANHIINVATYAELQAAFGFNPRGLHCFSIRGSELLTQNFVDGNFVYKVDIESNDYGDLDGDVDVDLADYNLFWGCLAGPGVSTPPGGCTVEMFAWADLDKDNDVDMDDYHMFQMWFTGPL